MYMKKASAKGAILATVVSHAGFVSYTAQADNWEQIGKKDQKLAKSGFDVSNLLERTTMNDKGIVETKLTAQEAAVSPLVSMTKDEPLVMGIFDGANDMGTIQVVTMKRHPDGSATLKQRFFTPHDFDPQSSGGQLSSQEYDVIDDRYGGNPFDKFKTNDSKYKHTFIKIKPEGLQTAMGLAMQRYGSSYGMYAFLEPKVRTWTTTSGNAFRKTVTTHVEAHFKPHWYLLTPSDVGVTYGTVGKPFYVLDNGIAVISGMSSHKIEGPTSNVNDDQVWVFYDKRSESGWTGITMVVVAVVAGALTGGAALTGLGAVMGGLAGGAGVASYAFVNGNQDLTEPVSGSMLNVTAVSDTKSLDYEGEWNMKWKNVMRDRVTEGPYNGSKLGTINDEFHEETDNWDELTITD